MNLQLLIDSIIRQTTVLIAQLATAQGVRAPLANVANQVFLDLANELNQQGVSRKVCADMFGMALRTYRRKIQRLSESSTERGRSLWEAVLSYVDDAGIATRADVLRPSIAMMKNSCAACCTTCARARCCFAPGPALVPRTGSRARRSWGCSAATTKTTASTS